MFTTLLTRTSTTKPDPTAPNKKIITTKIFESAIPTVLASALIDGKNTVINDDQSYALIEKIISLNSKSTGMTGLMFTSRFGVITEHRASPEFLESTEIDKRPPTHDVSLSLQSAIYAFLDHVIMIFLPNCVESVFTKLKSEQPSRIFDMELNIKNLIEYAIMRKLVSSPSSFTGWGPSSILLFMQPDLTIQTLIQYHALKCTSSVINRLGLHNYQPGHKLAFNSHAVATWMDYNIYNIRFRLYTSNEPAHHIPIDVGSEDILRFDLISTVSTPLVPPPAAPAQQEVSSVNAWLES